jgi:predicted nucleic acid-binding protein
MSASLPSLLQRYVVDTNVVLNFWIISEDEPFGKDVHVSAWAYLEEQINIGAVISPSYVKDELIKHGTPELIEWIKAHDSMFVNMSDEYVVPLIKIVKLHPIYKTTNGSKADAAIVALAASRNLCVITAEKRENELSRSKRNPKIPNVCEDMGTSWVSPTGFFRRENKSF